MFENGKITESVQASFGQMIEMSQWKE